MNRDLLAQLYPSLPRVFTVKICGIRGGLDPVTGGLWLTDIAHRHDAIAFLFLVAIEPISGIV